MQIVEIQDLKTATEGVGVTNNTHQIHICLNGWRWHTEVILFTKTNSRWP